MFGIIDFDMSIHEIKIYLDLNPESKSKVLDKYASKVDLGYFFFDSENGHCYLFDKDGKELVIKAELS